MRHASHESHVVNTSNNIVAAAAAAVLAAAVAAVAVAELFSDDPPTAGTLTNKAEKVASCLVIHQQLRKRGACATTLIPYFTCYLLLSAQMFSFWTFS